MKKSKLPMLVLGIFTIFSHSISATEPWTDSNIDVNTADGVRVLILHDMEGLSGQDDPLTFLFGTEQYPHGQDLLVADVNAVIKGLYAGGATEVFVVDAHGSTNPEPDILADKLDSRATQVFRDQPFNPYIDLVEPDAYDAVAVVGQHAKTGSRGFASHTCMFGTEVVVNGRTITETELIGLSYGEAGIPVIFASGDDRLGNDLQTMPWIHFVTTKKATSAATAELRPLAEVRRELEDKARMAIQNLDSARSMKVNAPVFVTVKAVPPADLSILDGMPGVNYRDGGVSFIAGDFHEAYRGILPITFVLLQSLMSPTFDPLMKDSGSADDSQVGMLMLKLFPRWLDAESGRLPAEQPVDKPKKQRYHGVK